MKILTLFLIFIYKLSFSQQFLNGSFENNSLSDCDTLNISNQIYNSLLPDVIGIGPLQGLDLLTDSCSMQMNVPAIEGHFFSSLESGWDSINTTAISLKLSSALSEFNQYVISFYSKSIKNISQFYPIEIIVGYSDTETSFGVPIDTMGLPDTVWTKNFVYLNPAFDAQYITVMGLPGPSITLFSIIDNFSFDTTGLYLSNGNLQTDIVELFPNPCNDVLNIKLKNVSHVNIYNSLAEIESVSFAKTQNGYVSVDVNSLSSGIYFLQVITDDKLFIRKFIKI